MVIKLYLTKWEEKALAGEYGSILALAIKVLVKVGEALGAERLIDISHAHISGISYFNIGDAGLEFLRDIAHSNYKVKVFTTANPYSAACIKQFIQFIGIDNCKKQLEIIQILKNLGIHRDFTCTPYIIKEPRYGEHLAWAESSAVIYANTVYGAKTNREGGPLALMAALVGKTYLAGLHLDENREPTLLVELRLTKLNPMLASLIGLNIGKITQGSIPYIKSNVHLDMISIKTLLAAIATTSDTAMTIIEGISPDAKKYCSYTSRLEKIIIDEGSVKYERDELCSEPDMIFIGCPHVSLEELKILERELGNKKIKKPIWVCISNSIMGLAERMNLVNKLKGLGVVFAPNTCFVTTPLHKIGIKCVATNSGKAMYYLPKLAKVKVLLASLRDLVKMAR